MASELSAQLPADIARTEVPRSDSPVIFATPEVEAPSGAADRASSPAADVNSVDTWSDVSSVSSIHFAAPSAPNAAGPNGTAEAPQAGPSSPPEPEYAHLGWVVHLPGSDGATYFTHRGYDVVTDIDIRSNEILYQVSEILAGLGVPPPSGWELWLHVEGDSRAPVCSFVNHYLRLVSSEPVSKQSSIADR